MNRYFRIFLILVAVVQALFAVGFALRVEVITRAWILPNTSILSFIFIGSIFAAAAASTLWCIFTAEEGALAGIGLDYLTILAPLSIFSLQIANGSTRLMVFAGLCIAGAVVGLAIFLHTRGITIRDTRPQPRLVRYSFIVFIIALLIVGGGLALKMPDVLPWIVTPEGSVMYGWMFLGAAAYFAYALLRPSWGNSSGQLIGFLAYDLVLILPFITRFSTEIPPQYVVGHIIYTIVVIYSAVLAIYFLFINPSTRLSR